MDRQVTLAVIIPVFNGEKYIKQSIYSVLNQPCKDLIVVVVNDGSKDNTQLIVEEIASNDNRVILLNQKNKGVSAARNNALDYCNSIINPRYIAFLDSDDVWVKNFYTEDLRDLLLDENKDFYMFEYFDGDENIKRGKLHVLDNAHEDDTYKKFGNYFCSLIYSNAVMRKYNIRFPEKIKVQEDVVFRYLFTTFSNRYSFVKKPIFVYRSNNNSVSHSKFNPSKRYFEDVVPAWEYVMDCLNKFDKHLSKKDYDKNIEQSRSMIKTYLIEFIQVSLAHGMKKEDINKQLKLCKYYSFLEDDSIWLDLCRKNIWSEFINTPLKLQIKLRTKYLVLNFLRKFRNVSFVVKKKYPIDISKLV